MFAKQTYIARRNELRRRMPKGGIVVLLGNSEAPRNYFDNAYSFRQDSTFLYYFGLQNADLVGVIDLDEEKDYLFGNDYTVDDIIWMGPQPSVKELGASVGVENTAPFDAARETIQAVIRQGRKVHYLVPYRGDGTLLMSQLTGIKTTEHYAHCSVEIGYAMHTTAMRLTREGVSERTIAGAMEGVTHQMGEGVSFHSIVSQHGETLHNHSHDGICTNGRLLLVDAGGESVNNYCSDHTRTFPVSGKFSPVQRDIYNIVLAAHDEVLKVARPGGYMNLHNVALKTLAEGLIGVGLMKGNADDAVAAGAVGLFMPHGLGHGLGMDVHDCEAMGERGMRDFSKVLARADEVDTCIIRSRWRLRPGTVLTDEPGIYFIPALIEQWKSEGKCRDFINYDRLTSFYDFGGIRLEDDLLITENGNIMLGEGKHIPITVEEVEEFMNK